MNWLYNHLRHSHHHLMHYGLLSLMGLTVACESTGGSSRRDRDNSSTRTATTVRTPADNANQLTTSSGKDSRDFKLKTYSDSMFASGGIVMNSLSNNPLTSAVIPRNQALEYANSIRRRKSANESTKLSGLKAARLGGADFHEVLEYAKPIMRTRIKQSKKVLPELALLEVGLASIQEKNIARARIFLEPLLNSTKNSRIKAAIHNAYGVAYLQVYEYTSAAQSFNKALRASPRFAPALYNLGLMALKFGHYREAQSHLSQLQSDWYAQTALITSDRQQARNNRVSSLCSKLTASNNTNKIILFNCGLFHLENLKQKTKARILIEKATQQPGGESSWDEIAFQTMEKIQ